MPNQNENIEKIRTILKSTSESEEAVLLLFELLIDHIEKLPVEEQQKFVLLWFFADWSHQKNIGKSIPALMLIKRLDKRLRELRLVKSDELFIKQLSDYISFSLLQEELQLFLKTYGLPADIVLFPYKYKRFVKYIINILLDKPLAFPDPHNKLITRLLDSTRKKQIKDRKGIISFNITNIDRALAEGSTRPSGEKAAALVILTNENSKIVVPL